MSPIQELQNHIALVFGNSAEVDGVRIRYRSSTAILGFDGQGKLTCEVSTNGPEAAAFSQQLADVRESWKNRYVEEPVETWENQDPFEGWKSVEPLTEAEVERARVRVMDTLYRTAMGGDVSAMVAFLKIADKEK